MLFVSKSTLYKLLLDAVTSNDVSKLSKLLSRRRTKTPQIIDQLSETGRTLLHLASINGLVDAVQLLLDAGADVHALDAKGLTPLQAAILCLHHYIFDPSVKQVDDDTRLAIVELLVKAGSNVNAVDEHGKTLLEAALSHHQHEIAKILIEADVDVDMVGSNGFSPLHFTLTGHYDELTTLLVKAGADVNVIDKNGYTPLLTALSFGNFELAKMLVEAGAEVELQNNRVASPIRLLLSITNTDISSSDIGDIFAFLATHGATVEGATATISPLVPSEVIRAIVPEDTPFWLAANNDAPMLAAELAGGLDPNMRTENGMTLLHWACAGDAPECVQLLLDAGADKEVGDPTPIFYCMHESSDCLKHLIDFDVDVNDHHRFRLPIHSALAANSPACVTVLVGAGAGVMRDEMRFNAQFSALHSALQMTRVPCDAIHALVEAAGGRILTESCLGMPLLYYTVQKSTVDGVRLLVECGVSIDEKYEEFDGLVSFAKHCASKTCDHAEIDRISKIIEYLETL